ncbi:MAG: hypothetical protein LUG18_13790 [Candidatus Azobacteroides sp.]|nr:hypothetical protein [Candidatus Azobacteroides sp.]
MKIMKIVLLTVLSGLFSLSVYSQATLGANTFTGVQTYKESLRLDAGKSLNLGYITSGDVRLKITPNASYGTYFDYSYGMYFRDANMNAVLTFTDEGYIGIGTNNPKSELHLNGDFTIRVGDMFTAHSTDRFTYDGKTLPTYGFSYDYDTKLGSSAPILYSSARGGMRFFTGGNNSLTILNNGNVGIGTIINPTNKLEVNGTIRAKEIRVESTGWSDFVFDPSYELPSLKDVKLHITQNRHLPGIPSENEVLENGINVSDIASKLLQKVEELTLYVIQQNEQLEEQKAINVKLMNKIEALENIK